MIFSRISFTAWLLLLTFPAGAMVSIYDLNDDCNQVLLTSPITSKFHFQYLKPEQSYIVGELLHRATLSHIRIEHVAKEPPYFLTFDDSPRQSQWPREALKELSDLTQWQQPFGVSYDPLSDKTKFIAIGHPNLVSSIELAVYESHISEKPLLSLSLAHDPNLNDGLAWVGEVLGPLEGLWYEYRYKAQPGAKSDFGEPAPSEYIALDPFAPWAANNRGRVYFPPRTSPKSKYKPTRPLTTLEIGLRDTVTLDLASEEFGAATAIVKSRFLQKLTAPFSAIELLPVRNYETVETFPSQPYGPHDTLYFHFLAYMPTSTSISLDIGGPEGIFHLKEFL